MRRWLSPVHVLVAIAAAALAGRPGVAKGPEIFPLSEVRVGMRGYGLTVLHGTTPERFDFEVVGIARKIMPRMDLILFRSDDPKLAVTGVARGMSGSPLYLDGKIACALSYSWAFNKLAMGGCTPIEYMIAEAEHPWRGTPEQTAAVRKEEWQRLKPVAAFLEPPAPLGNDWFAATMPSR